MQKLKKILDFSVALCLCGEALVRGPRKSAPVKLDGLAHMRKKVIRVVAARIQMELVPYAFCQQLLMHAGSAIGKAVFVLLTTVEVDSLCPDLDLIFPR